MVEFVVKANEKDKGKIALQKEEIFAIVEMPKTGEVILILNAWQKCLFRWNKRRRYLTLDESFKEAVAKLK